MGIKLQSFTVGDTVRVTGTNTLGLVVRKYVTQTTRTEIYDVLLESGILVTKMPTSLKQVIIREDGVEINV